MQPVLPFDLPPRAPASPSRDHAMAVVSANAEEHSPGWHAAAAAFLRSFVKTRAQFVANDVCEASRQAGIQQPHDDRAWGSIFRAAEREGLIAKAGMGRNPKRHASICIQWRAA